MKCANCGAELADRSRFCEKCGIMIEHVTQGIDCPACGGKLQLDDVFCSICGTRLPAWSVEGMAPECSEVEKHVSEDHEMEKHRSDTCESEENIAEKLSEDMVADTAEEPSVERMSKDDTYGEEPDVSEAIHSLKSRLLIPAVTVLVLLIAVISTLNSIRAKKPEVRRQSEVLYYKEDALFLTDIHAENESAEVTDECVDLGIPLYVGIVAGDMISEDGTYLFYREENDGVSYSLYRMSRKGSGAGEKIASNVTSYEPLHDNTVVYMKQDSLYYYDGKDSVRLGRYVSEYQVNKEKKTIYWSEADGRDRNIIYCQDLAGQAGKEEIEKNAEEFYANEDLTCFLSLKGGVLYLLDHKGEKERVAQNVIAVISYDLDQEKIYYLTEGPIRMAYSDVIYDDGEMTEEDWAVVARMNQFEIPYMKLRYHTSGGDAVISDYCYYDNDSMGNLRSEAGEYCLYVEGPRVEKLQTGWSEIKENLESENFGSLLLEQMKVSGKFSGIRLAAAERTVAEYEDMADPNILLNSWMNQTRNGLYMNVVNPDMEDGTLYEITLSGSDAGVLHQMDEYTMYTDNYIVSADGLYYIKDSGENGGDLYLNGKEIAYDVHKAWLVGDHLLAYTVDYDRDNSGGADFTLLLLSDGEKISVSKEVSYADCTDDGTVIMITDYDSVRGVGELLYFNGKDSVTIAKQVTGFVARNSGIGIE